MSKKINVYHLRSASFDKEIVKNGEKRVIKVGGTPYATVAVTFNEDGTVNRGVSICSPHDPFVRSVGSAKAIGRLKKAAKTESDVYPINGFKKLESKILKKIGSSAKDEVSFDMLGYYHSEPNELEKSIFKSELGIETACERGC